MWRALFSPRELAVDTGSGWRRRGGPAAWSRWITARAVAGLGRGAKAGRPTSPASRPLRAGRVVERYSGSMRDRHEQETGSWTKNRVGRPCAGISTLP